jgi:Tfp pilus assembly protein PilZ
VSAKKQLHMRLKDPSTLFDGYVTDTPCASVIVPSAARVEEEESVELHLMFADSNDRYVVSGAVQWCKEDQQAGFLIAIGVVSIGFLS